MMVIYTMGTGKCHKVGDPYMHHWFVPKPPKIET